MDKDLVIQSLSRQLQAEKNNTINLILKIDELEAKVKDLSEDKTEHKKDKVVKIDGQGTGK